LLHSVLHGNVEKEPRYVALWLEKYEAHKAV